VTLADQRQEYKRDLQKIDNFVEKTIYLRRRIQADTLRLEQETNYNLKRRRMVLARRVLQLVKSYGTWFGYFVILRAIENYIVKGRI